ncbi:MAG: SPFH domain-containing protein [Acidobacteriota bacterium]
MRERLIEPRSGLLMLCVLLLTLIGSVVGIIRGAATETGLLVLCGLAGVVLSIFFLCGLFMVNPNEARVLQLFGSYVGSVREPGLRWANPFFSKRRVSLRVRNFESGTLKVNDADGNPIEIAAVVVWKVTDSAEALFEVDDYEHYVRVQSEAAVRTLAQRWPYDAHDDAGEEQVSLRGSAEQVTSQLKTQIQDRLDKAGVEVLEARLSHLAYAPEIAGAMLQRQQANAVVAARTKIVEGAVGMVDLALEKLEDNDRVNMDERRKADMVANLLVVLCSDRGAQPVVSTSSSE